MIKGKDGYSQGADITADWYARECVYQDIIADLTVERDRYKASASLARESLRVIASFGDLLIEALGIMRLSMTGLSVGTIKRIENIRQVIRTIQDGYQD